MAVLVSDSFNRADNATLLGSTDSYNGGSSYTWANTVGTTWGISSNQLYQSAVIANGITSIPLGIADNIRISVELPISPGLQAVGLSFRVVDGGSFFRATISSGLKIEKRISFGSYTTVGSYSGSITYPIKISVELEGSTIRGYLNDVLVITASDTSFQTATKHGVHLHNSTSPRLDNFQIEGLSTGTTQEGASSVTGVSTLSASATVIPAAITGSASLQGVAIISATADVISPSLTGSASLTGVGSITATASVIRTASAVLQGVSTLTANAAGLNVLGGAFLTGVGWLMASAIEGTELISVIRLMGKRDLDVQLYASQELTVNLYGSR